MKILMYRWKAYNQQDIVEQLERRGHTVDEIRGEMSNFDPDMIFYDKFVQKLDGGEYDMVFTVNYFPLISIACEARGIRYVSWCCDSPIGTMYHNSVYNKVNTIFTFDMFSKVEFEDMGTNVLHLPLCGAVERVDALLSEASDLEQYDCDVSFIGSMYDKNSYDEVYDHLPEYLKGYFDSVLKVQTGLYGEYILDDVLDAATVRELNKHFILAKSEDSFSDLSLVFATTVLGFKIAQMERKSLLAKLSRVAEVDLYTDDKNFDKPGVNNRGIADYWEVAPKVFNRSKINLNFTIRNIRTGIPLRVWDILSAGGFCITNYQPELLMYFENGKDIVIFEDAEDLIEKVKYYLTHEEERKQIALNGYNKVKNMHRYCDRFDEIKKIIPEI